MRAFVLTAVGLAILAIPGLASTHTQVFESPAGGSLWFKLRGGDLRITHGTDLQHVVVRYTPEPKKPESEKEVQIESRVHGSQLQIEVKAPMSVSVDVEVEVPSPISLEIHMTGGDLTVEGVEGDKNIQLFAGDLKVDVGTLQNIRDAEVSVHVGDISVPDIGEVHGWLGRTWKYQGGGQYRLFAHTGFGDVSLLTR